ncbi:MAG: Ldh family oxidoreductase [Gammaproteobacteria bacterium]|nr:Ldh family oxidoreductase [Gammaproteobacteria bacterium]
MRLNIARAHTLTCRVLQAAGLDPREAAIVADHLIDCELRGLSYGGLPRALSIFERMTAPDYRRGAIEVARETPISALVVGRNNPGYLVAFEAANIAIDKATTQGMAMVGGNQTWHTGMLSYYAERAAEAGLVSLIASNASPLVAPYGGRAGRFGTNPICFGFPSADQPVIWDIGTSSIMHGEIVLARRLGLQLPQGIAFDAEGEPTTDPDAALAGVVSAWGGHRGSGLAIVVQLLGAMAAAPAMPLGMVDYGCLFVMMKPDLLMDANEYAEQVAEYARVIRATPPVKGGEPVRMPFDRSRATRERNRQADAVEVSDTVYERLEAAAGSNRRATD